jgi:PAS domain S-box-containing protein
MGVLLFLKKYLTPIPQNMESMHEVKGFPPTAMETLEMLATFTGSAVALTVETQGNVSFIHADTGNKIKEESSLQQAINQSTKVGKGITGWFELNDPSFVHPFKTGRFFNLNSKSLNGNNRLCLFTNSPQGWDQNQLLLMDQTRRSIEQQFENYFFENNITDEENSDRFRLLFDFSPVGIFFYSTSLKISAFNERFISILDAPAGKLLNFDLNKVTDRSIIPAIRKPLSGEEGIYEGSYLSTISGKEVNVILITAPILKNSKEITGVIGVVQDNTERINTLKELKESKDRLKSLINATPDIICFK